MTESGRYSETDDASSRTCWSLLNNLVEYLRNHTLKFLELLTGGNFKANHEIYSYLPCLGSVKRCRFEDNGEYDTH